jgi:predicted Fe-Mo cluster-binding NifX family protein
MKIAISSSGADLNAQVDPRFGRCQYFIIVDPDTMKFEALENNSASSGGGAGIAAGQFVVGKGVGAVLTGHCGPNAFNVLEAAGVKVMTGVSGTVQDAVEGYKSGKYQADSKPDAAPHSGMDRNRT